MRCFCGAPATTVAYWNSSLGLCGAHAVELADCLDAEGLWPPTPWGAFEDDEETAYLASLRFIKEWNALADERARDKENR
jgi:hypothetical protein